MNGRLNGYDAGNFAGAGPASLWRPERHAVCLRVAGRRGHLMSVPLRVLLVEDSEDDALLLLRELRRGGYDPLYERVDTAPAMEAALDERAWDLVIADHSMPAFSSSAALELLRR